jgi:LysM repeat protein
MNSTNHQHNQRRKSPTNQTPKGHVRTRQNNLQVRVIERMPAGHPINPGKVLGFLFLSGLILIPMIVVILVGGFYGYYQVSGRIIPGVKIASSDVGGMLITEAALELEKTWNLENQIELTSGMHTISVSPAELGLRLDALATVQDAYQVGHENSIPDRFGHLLVSVTQGWEITPTINFDRAQARAGLEKLVPNMSAPPQNASIRVDGSNLTAIPGEIGYTINIDDTLSILEKNPLSVMQNKVLIVQLLPLSPQVSDLTPILKQAKEFIKTPASFRAYDALSNEYLEFSIPKETLLSWLSLEIEDQKPIISLDKAKVTISLQQWQDSLGEERYFDAEVNSPIIAEAVKNQQVATILISHAPTTYSVQPGDTLLRIGWKIGMPFWKIIQANPGIDPDHLQSGSLLTIPSKDELIPLPVVLNKRVVISIQKQRLWVYQDGGLISEHIISTGIDRSPTQPGIFQVQTHEKNAYALVFMKPGLDL